MTTNNDWFFDKWNQTKQATKSNNVYDLVKSGYSVLWSALDEQGRYEVWSLHIESGGAPFSYPAFCEFMDSTQKFND